MDDTYTSKYNGRNSNLKRLLLLVCLTGLQLRHVLSTEEENELTSEPDDTSKGGLEVVILGPDYVTVGVPCSFECEADCPSASCTYSMSVDGQAAQGHSNALVFTLDQWVETLTLTCTARDDDTGLSDTITKKLQVLAGPANVSISGSDMLNPAASHSYSCHAYCRPSCSYTWQIDAGPWLGGQGNIITVTPQEMDASKTLICKATNSVSGLFVTKARYVTVTSGPSEVHIQGPDTIEVARRSTFICTADCVPSCRFLWSVADQMLKGSEIEMTAESPVKSVTMKCEAQNTVSRKTATVLKTVRMRDHNESIHVEKTSALLLCTFIICTVMIF